MQNFALSKDGLRMSLTANKQKRNHERAQKNTNRFLIDSCNFLVSFAKNRF